MVWDLTEIQQEIVPLPELPDVPSRTQDPQAVYNTKAFNFRAAERELQQKFNINVPLLNTVLKSSTDILPNMDAINTVAGADNHGFGARRGGVRRIRGHGRSD